MREPVYRIGVPGIPVREISMSFGRGTKGRHENGPVATITVLVVHLMAKTRRRLARPV